jgi:hypothetical protein
MHGYMHQSVNHTIGFNCQCTAAHTNTIESTSHYVHAFLNAHNRKRLRISSRPVHVHCTMHQFIKFLQIIPNRDWSVAPPSPQHNTCATSFAAAPLLRFTLSLPNISACHPQPNTQCNTDYMSQVTPHVSCISHYMQSHHTVPQSKVVLNLPTLQGKLLLEDCVSRLPRNVTDYETILSHTPQNTLTPPYFALHALFCNTDSSANYMAFLRFYYICCPVI